jgi:two-component system chemotaxis response regulator CheB
MAIKRCGGVAIVQDPEEAPFPEMPRTAIANVDIDHKVLVSDMGRLIEDLIAQPVPADGRAPRDLEMEARISETGYSDEDISSHLGEPTPLSCPECGGPLWQRDSGNLVSYRCRVGHAYSGHSLLLAADETLESTIWAAIRLFDQRANVLTSLAQKDRPAGRTRLVRHQELLASEARSHAIALRKLLMRANS